MAAPYEPPEWGLDGKNVFGISLDVVRNGMLVETLALPLDPAKSFVVAGRMEPLCDLVLQHPSLSRVHAVLQFDAHGALFVQDMKSTHGTFVNKKRLAPLRFQRVHVGDLLVFGESTRKYAVCGPEELRPEEPDMVKLRAKIEANKQAEKKQEEREASGASWGFREDAEEEEDDDDASSSDDEGSKNKPKQRGGDADLPDYLRGLKEHGRTSYESSVQKTDVSEKDQKLFTQLQNKIAKMENLETEKARIVAKENNLQGLTEGQQKTLERNSARITSLAKEIEELEDRIHARNAQRDQSRAVNQAREGRATKSKAAAAAYAYDSDEDDFYDRTSANQKKLQERKQLQDQQSATTKTTAETTTVKKKPTTEVLTAEIIQRKIKLLESDLRDVNAELARVEADEDAKIQADDATELDALEAFMQSTAKELYGKELQRVRTRQADVETELKKQRQLLAIALPALRHANYEPQSLAVASVPSKPGPSSTLESEEATPRPVETETVVETKVADEKKEEADTTHREPQVKSQHRPREEETVDREEKTSEPPKKRRVMGPTLPPPRETPAKAVDGSTLEGGDRVWVPPANQTGDGRTTLNDKYGY